MTSTFQPDPEMLGAAMIGYYQAVQRFLRDATRVTERDDGFAALASATECLFWACSLEEHMRDNDPTYLCGADDYGRRLVQGARWARNQATRQLAFIVAHTTARSIRRPILRHRSKWCGDPQARCQRRTGSLGTSAKHTT
ncbi:hypothetical protein [Streptomyces sp. YIM S03343]